MKFKVHPSFPLYRIREDGIIYKHEKKLFRTPLISLLNSSKRKVLIPTTQLIYEAFYKRPVHLGERIGFRNGNEKDWDYRNLYVIHKQKVIIKLTLEPQELSDLLEYMNSKGLDYTAKL